MEAVAALSLVCNIMQVVDSGLQVTALCRKFYKTGQGKPELRDVTNEFRGVYDVLIQSEVSSSAVSADDQAIIDLARKCDDSAKELLAELKKLDGRQGSKLSALKGVMKTIWKSSKIEDLEKKFDSYRKVFETRILVDLRARYNLNAIKKSEAFDHLSEMSQNLILKLEAGHTRIETILTNQHRENKELLETLVSKTSKIQIDKDHEEILDSLNFPEMTSRKATVSDAYTNTFSWILDPPESSQTSDSEVSQSSYHLYRWLTSGGGIFWICGKAGSGKSTLMRYICEDPRTKAALGNSSRLSRVLLIEYYLWIPGSKLQKSTVGLMRAILFQLVKASPGLAELCVSETGVGLAAWTETRLRSVLFATIKHATATKSLCILIDGLDELEGDLDYLLYFIHKVSQIKNVKCLVSSRPWRVFENSFSTCPQIRLENLNKHDIRHFVEGKTKAMGDHFTPYQVNSLVNDLVEKAEGVFLWVSLATASILQGLQDGDKFAESKQKLDNLPKELNDLYDTLLSRIGLGYKRQAMRIFELLLLDKGDSDSFEFSVLTLSLANLRLPKPLDFDEGVLTSRSKLIEQCNLTMTYLLQRCGGFLNLRFDSRSKSAIEVPGERIPEKNERIPRKLTTLTEADILRCEFLHRTVFDYLKQVLVVSEEPSKHEDNISATEWLPAVARAESHVRKILPMRDILESNKNSLFSDRGFTSTHPIVTQLVIAVRAVREAEILTTVPQHDLLFQIDSHGATIMRMATQHRNLDSGSFWGKLILPGDFEANCRSQILSSLLEVCSCAGFDDFVTEELSKLSSEDHARECTRLLSSVIGSTISVRFLMAREDYSVLVGRDNGAFEFLRGRFSSMRFFKHVKTFLDDGADPNGRMDSEAGLLAYMGEFIRPRELIGKTPQPRTIWSLFLTTLSNSYSSELFVRRDDLPNLQKILMAFIEKGADVKIVIPYLSTSFAVRSVSASSREGQRPRPFFLTFMYDAGVLPILQTCFYGEEAGHSVIQKLKSLGALSDLHFRCLQLEIRADSEENMSGATKFWSEMLKFPAEAPVLKDSFLLSLEHTHRIRRFSWDLTDLVDQIGPQILAMRRPEFSTDGEVKYSALWKGGMVLNKFEDDSREGSSETVTPSKVLQEVMRILNDAAESGTLKRCDDYQFLDSRR